MSINRISNRIVQLSNIAPDSGAATTVGDVWINLGNNQTGQYEVLAWVRAGTVVGTIDANLVQATDNAGSGSKPIPNTVITQITATGNIAKIELRHDDGNLDLAGGFTFVNLTITTTNAGDFVQGNIEGGVYAFDEDAVGPQNGEQADEIVRHVIV